MRAGLRPVDRRFLPHAVTVFNRLDETRLMPVPIRGVFFEYAAGHIYGTHGSERRDSFRLLVDLARSEARPTPPEADPDVSPGLGPDVTPVSALDMIPDSAPGLGPDGEGPEEVSKPVGRRTYLPPAVWRALSPSERQGFYTLHAGMWLFAGEHPLYAGEPVAERDMVPARFEPLGLLLLKTATAEEAGWGEAHTVLLGGS